MQNLDSTAVITALPAMARDLGEELEVLDGRRGGRGEGEDDPDAGFPSRQGAAEPGAQDAWRSAAR
jgi:hypothetical protein